ncbi:hypothetical protein EPN87_01990 [archaeon]|nr:MAG: hypothetical protein EPN87_01990 [archaeon]
MKRGRPNVRNTVSKSIVTILESSRLPMATSTICKMIEKDTQKKVSWNTVQKYIDEMMSLGKIEPTVLPHSKDENKKGLTVYSIKRA